MYNIIIYYSEWCVVYEGWVMTLDVTKVISVSLELEGRQTV